MLTEVRIDLPELTIDKFSLDQFGERWLLSHQIQLLLPFLSPAKEEINASAMVLSMSPISTKNRGGPSADACGTPDITGVGSNPFTINYCSLFVRKESVQENRVLLIPSKESFFRTMVW